MSRQRKRPLTEETSLNKKVNSYIVCFICSLPRFIDNNQERERKGSGKRQQTAQPSHEKTSSSSSSSSNED